MIPPRRAHKLAEAVARRLAERGLSLALAEASTGGALADALCALPGASAYFLGGIVAYSNSSKETLLGVPAELLEHHGAVSPEAAEAMALGAQRAFGSNLGLAVTGILGPGGGTPSKPVGLTYVAVAGPTGTRVERHLFHGHRAQNKTASVGAALRLLSAE